MRSISTPATSRRAVAGVVMRRVRFGPVQLDRTGSVQAPSVLGPVRSRSRFPRLGPVRSGPVALGGSAHGPDRPESCPTPTHNSQMCIVAAAALPVAALPGIAAAASQQLAAMPNFRVAVGRWNSDILMSSLQTYYLFFNLPYTPPILYFRILRNSSYFFSFLFFLFHSTIILWR